MGVFGRPIPKGFAAPARSGADNTHRRALCKDQFPALKHAPMADTDPAAPEPPDHRPLYARLDALAIAYSHHEHAPVFTVAESRALRGQLAGAHIKNLFLRDKKRRMFLVTVLEDKPVDLKALKGVLGAQGNLSFGDAERLWTHLGVRPGSVTPLAALNDVDGAVTVALDRDLLAADTVYCHPLRNDMNTGLAPGDLVRFLEAEGHLPQIIEIPVRAP